jgi:hypothetical protein
LERIRRRHNAAGRRKPLEDAYPVLIEVLRLINHDQGETSCDPLPDSVRFQKRGRQKAGPVELIQRCGLLLKRGGEKAPAPCGQRAGQHIEGLAFKPPAKERVRPQPLPGGGVHRS